MRAVLPLGALALIALGTACVPGELESCYPGLALGDRVEIELIEPYVREGPYTWVEYLGAAGGAASCEGRDGLVPGAYAFEIVDSTGVNGCLDFAISPSSPIGAVEFGAPRPTAGPFLSSFARHCGGIWTFVAFRPDPTDLDPFGEEARPGAYPPLVVRREVTDECGPPCADRWVAEIRHLGPVSSDASTLDGGSR